MKFEIKPLYKKQYHSVISDQNEISHNKLDAQAKGMFEENAIS